jgi:hypothetical protein
MRTIQQVCEEHLVVTDELTVQGAVTAGATVHSGGCLVVQGAFTGPLTVEEDASAHVQGSFNGEIDRNDGLVLLYGQVGLAFRPGIGRVAVGIDSLLTYDGPQRLLPDGTVEDLPPGNYGPNSFNVDTSRMCVYVEDQERFHPVKLDK